MYFLVSNRAGFEALYGDGFIIGWQLGGSFAGAISLTTSSSAEKSSLKEALGASLSGYGATLETDLARIQSSEASRLSFHKKTEVQGTGLVRTEQNDLTTSEGIKQYGKKFLDEALAGTSGRTCLKAIFYGYDALPCVLKRVHNLGARVQNDLLRKATRLYEDLLLEDGRAQDLGRAYSALPLAIHAKLPKFSETQSDIIHRYYKVFDSSIYF